MTPRFFFPVLAEHPPAPDSHVMLPTDIAHHATRVLRLRDGEAIVLFDGWGTEYTCVLQADGYAWRALIKHRNPVDRESPLRLTLVQALAVNDKMDWVVQKAVEMGVACVQPIAAERSVLKLEGSRAEKRRAHWWQVAIGASEQSGRNRLMEVGEICTLQTWLAKPFAGQRWILDPEEGTPLSAQPRPHQPVAVLIGPEGGWSPAELAAAQLAGCTRIQMGPRVLRTETVGVAIAGAMMALWGDY